MFLYKVSNKKRGVAGTFASASAVDLVEMDAIAALG